MYIIFNGTNRNESISLQISKLVAKHLNKLKEKNSLIDLKQLPNDLICPDIYENPSSAIKKIESKIQDSKGIFFIVPEYNGSFPGILKYIIDLLNPSIFHQVPTSYIGVASGMFGSLRSVEQLQMILQYREAYIFPKRTFFMEVHNKLNEERTEITDLKVKEKFYSNIEEFVSFSKCLTE